MKKRLIAIAIVISSFCIAGFTSQNAAAEPQLVNLDKTICQDSKTGLMWQLGKSRSYKDMGEAVDYAENLTLAGHSDWRLPTVEERLHLKQLFDLQRNGDCDLVRLDSSYWTTETKHYIAPGRLEPNDECGGGYDFIIKKKGYVRAVRP